MNSLVNRNASFPASLFLKGFLFFLAGSLFCLAGDSQAQTWVSSPGSGFWNTAANWTSPSAVPNAQNATAIFNTSSTTSLALSAGVSVGTIQFNSVASAFTIDTNSNFELAFFGTGIVNNSASVQSLNNSSFNGKIDFYNSSTAGNANITNNSLLAFHNNSTAGAATITNSNPGNIYFYDNSTAGAASIVTGSLSQFQNNSTAGNATIVVITNGSVNFNDDATAGHSTITNGGNIIFNGQGNGVSFSTAGNATITNNHVIDFYDYSTGGTAAITNNANIYFNNNSTAGNSTLINSGSVTFFDDSSTGNSTVTNGGNLTFNGQGNGVSFSTAGSATITNNNTMNFNDYSTAGAASITNNQTMSFNNNSTANNATINNASGGTLDFVENSTAGNSNISNNGGANLFFLDNSTAGNARITNDNTLNFEQNASAGNANIIYNNGGLFLNNSTAGNSNITNNSNLFFEQSSTAGNTSLLNNSQVRFIQTSSAGGATITTNNGGYVLIENTASGGTARFIFNGNGYLDISYETAGTPATIGSLEGSGAVSLGANNLTTGANNLSVSYAGIISDGGQNGGFGGSLTKVGAGTFALSGNNNYTGGTSIIGGTLVTTNSSALGTGLVDVNGGILSLSGPLTLNIGGNYTQTSSGALQLGLSGTGAGQWDNLNITGSTTLAGNLKVISYSHFQTHGGETFELLNSTGSLSGNFGTVTDLLLEPVSIVYTPNEVLLETLTFSQFGSTFNQTAVASGLDSLTALSANPTLLNALDSLPTSSLASAYDQISPSNLTPLFKIGFMAEQAQGELIWQRLSQYREIGSQSSPYAVLDSESPMFASNMPVAQEAQMAQGIQSDRWGVFVSGIGNFGTVTSDGNGAGYQFSTGGTTAGVDYRFSKDFVGGLLFGYDQSSTSQSTGTVNTTGGQAGLYAGLKADQYHLDVLVDGGLDSYATQRTSFGGTATGSISGMEYTGQLNMGFDFEMGDFGISPFASGQYTQMNVNGFSETGSLAPLTYGNQGESYLVSDLGSQFGLKLKLGGVNLLPNVSGAWEHVYQGNVDSLTATLGAGSSFTVNGSATGTDAAVVGGGLNIEFSRNFNLYAEYQGKMGMTNYTSQSFTGGINLFFGSSGSQKTYGEKITPKVDGTANPVTTPSVAPSPATLSGSTLPPAPQMMVPVNLPKVQTTVRPAVTPSPTAFPAATQPTAKPIANPAIVPHAW